MQTHCRPDLIPDTWLCQSSSSLAWQPRGKTLVNISHLALQTEASQYPFELWLWTTVHYQCVSLPVCQKIRGWESEVSNWCTEAEIQICVAVPSLPREKLIGLSFLCSSPTRKHLKTPLQVNWRWTPSPSRWVAQIWGQNGIQETEKYSLCSQLERPCPSFWKRPLGIAYVKLCAKEKLEKSQGYKMLAWRRKEVS